MGEAWSRDQKRKEGRGPWWRVIPREEDGSDAPGRPTPRPSVGADNGWTGRQDGTRILQGSERRTVGALRVIPL